MNWIKYNLKKDGSPIWQGVDKKEDIPAVIEKLTAQGYSPRIAHATNKGV